MGWHKEIPRPKKTYHIVGTSVVHVIAQYVNNIKPTPKKITFVLWPILSTKNPVIGAAIAAMFDKATTNPAFSGA